MAAAIKLLNEVLNYHIEAPFSAYIHCNKHGLMDHVKFSESGCLWMIDPI
jgi:hypothetical protein